MKIGFERQELLEALQKQARDQMTLCPILALPPTPTPPLTLTLASTLTLTLALTMTLTLSRSAIR